LNKPYERFEIRSFMSLKAQTLRAHGYNFSCSSRTIKSIAICQIANQINRDRVKVNGSKVKVNGMQ